jgi:serine/threonine protein kinase
MFGRTLSSEYESMNSYHESLRHGDPLRDKPISQEGKDFLRKLLDVDPVRRVSAAEAMLDPWILKHLGNNPEP